MGIYNDLSQVKDQLVGWNHSTPSRGNSLSCRLGKFVISLELIGGIYSIGT